MIFNTTGGGTALNFKVLAYATEAALQAATPVENTIGIITETPITSWIFSAEEPSPAAAGMVWITIGTSSPAEFNALKKNGIQVYPISATQYVGGAWVDKTAKSYQGGVWVNWIRYLLSNDNLHKEVTGGWELSEGYTFEKQPDGTFYLARSSSATYDPINTKNKIDVTNYTKAIMKQKSASRANVVSIEIVGFETHANNTLTGQEDIVLDISEISGDVYIGLTVSQGHNCYIEEVRLEA
jgi:hypothetical protein